MSEKQEPAKRKQQEPAKPGQRKRSRRAKERQAQAVSEGRQQQEYSELSAVGHILSDRVHMYAMEHPLSVGELRQLSAWDDAVQTQIHRYNKDVLENVKLMTEYKKSSKIVSNLRDDLVALRASARRMKQETNQLEKKLQQTNEDSQVLQGASRFLTAVEKLGKACRDSD